MYQKLFLIHFLEDINLKIGVFYKDYLICFILKAMSCRITK